jgi:NTE family protein/lysophospholipid hydrolase
MSTDQHHFGFSPSEVKSHLASTELFQTLDESILDEITTQVEVIRVPGGDSLFKQGDAGDSLYIVINGRLRVIVRREDNQEDIVAELGREEMVGEMALLTGENRSATVRALRDTTLIRLSNEGCNYIAERHPFIVLQMARTLARRLATRNRAAIMTTPVINIALIPTSPEVQLSPFATHFTIALGKIGSVLHLNSRGFYDLQEKKEIGPSSPDIGDTIKFENWLNEQESKYRFIVYEADASPSNWTQRCIRQADRILLIGESPLPPQPSRLESELLDPKDRRTMASVEFVLLHPEKETAYTDTNNWLQKRHVTAHHHVHHRSSSDFDRLARLLTGEATGLALGGGGLRGLAHLGVIRALQESGFSIDCIGGTSLGAIMAAQFALGWDYDTMVKANEKMWRNSWPMNDYTIPFMAALEGHKLDQTLKAMCGDVRIEDLPLNYFCVSTNLTTANIAIHREGLLWKRLRASCALPGIVPPDFDNGFMLVDGAVLNNVPGDIMKKVCGGKVIAVDVSPREDLIFQPQYPQRPLTRQILWGRMNPFIEMHRLPSLFDIVSRSAMISNVSKSNLVRDQVDLYLDIPLDQFGMSDSKSFYQIIETGYQAASRQIEAWKQKEKN